MIYERGLFHLLKALQRGKLVHRFSNREMGRTYMPGSLALYRPGILTLGWGLPPPLPSILS